MIDRRADGHENLCPRRLTRVLAAYQAASYPRGVMELALTAVPLAGIVAAMWQLLQLSPWIALPLAVPAAGFVVRLFIIQHDCGHGSFFRHRLANDWVGRVLGVVTLTPYDFWRSMHAVHHATSGNLDARGIGDIDVLTVDEFRRLPRRRQLLYRLYRHPLVLFGLGPAYYFVARQRLPMGMMHKGWRPWISTMGTNVAIAAVAAALIWGAGIGAFLFVALPTSLIAMSAGMWLFYVQHQFEATYWAREKDWSFHEAALYGSSHYDLPAVLRWMTANIGVHHIHHLSSRIPFYRLQRVLRDHPELAAIRQLTLRQSLGCVAKVLWDERKRKLVSFRELASIEAGRDAPPARNDDRRGGRSSSRSAC